MMTHVQFKSSSFPKYENEDEETVNETRWGKRLAEFVRDHLPKYGVETEEILCEDWGWLVYIKNAEFPLWIGCGPVDDFDEPESTELNASAPLPIEFALFVAAEPGFLKKLFRKVNTEPGVGRVVRALEEMIAGSDCFNDVEWSEGG